jgi:capsule biosynthesis phosphatase|tara:strand:+ start:331 stop:714 length:384 start_codon:yes stop_codon:yes gene_type:complete
MENEINKPRGPIIIDLDDTITRGFGSYETIKPNKQVVNKINEYRAIGFEVVIFTARNMRKYSKDISKITLNTVPKIIKWLEKNKIEVDGVIVGKPWCGYDGFYVDDKSIRPDEFVNLSFEEIKNLIK